MESGSLFQLATYVLTACGSLLAAGWFSALWISRLRDDIKESINAKIEKLEQNILDKLTYHERHDDDRFSKLQNDIWSIRVTNAAQQKAIDERLNP